MLEFQPRHCLRTGALLAIETTLRWLNRRMGAINSGMAPTSTDRGLSNLLAGWLLRTACAEAVAWDRGDVRLSVKLPGLQLQGEALCLQVSTALAETGLAPERLELALPEHLTFGLDEDATIAFAGLRDIGVDLLLDEFGHVVASLIALRDIPLTALKVDRLMLRALPLDVENLAILQAVIATSHGLGLRVCADGIDSDRQREKLMQLHVDEGQGGVFSPPLSLADVRFYLQK